MCKKQMPQCPEVRKKERSAKTAMGERLVPVPASWVEVLVGWVGSAVPLSPLSQIDRERRKMQPRRSAGDDSPRLCAHGAASEVLAIKRCKGQGCPAYRDAVLVVLYLCGILQSEVDPAVVKMSFSRHWGRGGAGQTYSIVGAAGATVLEATFNGSSYMNKHSKSSSDGLCYQQCGSVTTCDCDAQNVCQIRRITGCFGVVAERKLDSAVCRQSTRCAASQSLQTVKQQCDSRRNAKENNNNNSTGGSLGCLGPQGDNVAMTRTWLLKKCGF